MLLFGSYELIPYIPEGFNCVVVNFSSLKEGFGKPINMVPRSYNPYESREFDIDYANLILSDTMFFSFFESMIYPLYQGVNIYAMVTRDDLFDIFTESIQKFILERYGYTSYLINEPSDFSSINELNDRFSVAGIYNLDTDKERYSYQYARTHTLRTD